MSAIGFYCSPDSLESKRKHLENIDAGCERKVQGTTSSEWSAGRGTVEPFCRAQLAAMDLKGQQRCEWLFLYIMWTTTVLACGATFALDDVSVMFKVFGSGLVLSLLVCFCVSFAFQREQLWAISAHLTWLERAICFHTQLCLPEWGQFNRDPLSFVAEPAKAEEAG